MKVKKCQKIVEFSYWKHKK